MKRRIIHIVWPCIVMLAACTEEPQKIGSNAKADTSAFQGTGKPYAEKGWKAGDKASWEQHLKVRTQSGQNDYTKVN